MKKQFWNDVAPGDMLVTHFHDKMLALTPDIEQVSWFVIAKMTLHDGAIQIRMLRNQTNHCGIVDYVSANDDDCSITHQTLIKSTT